MSSIVDRWNTSYFDGALSPDALAAMGELATAEPDAQALADRMLRLMRSARFDAVDLSLLTAWAIGFSAPRTVPSAWGGMVPPVTMPGRHHRIDEYLVGNPWHQPAGRPVLVDLGCGFPPFTTVESAALLPEWQVIGVDPALARYLVYDEHGEYACVDEDGRVGYYQSGNVDPDQESTRARFRDLLTRLLPLLPEPHGEDLHDVREGGARLVRNPLRWFEKPNLTFERGEIGTWGVEGGADVIRCMNVFMYFDRPFRLRALRWASGLLRPGGLLLCGSNWARSASSRYTVYQKCAGALVPREFAFGIENVRPLEISPWYALYDDDTENLCNAAAVAAIRADGQFRRHFDEGLDALLARWDFCARRADGYLGGPADDLSVDQVAEHCQKVANELRRDALVDGAVAVLRRAGHHAWRNVTGHIAMRPFDPPPLPESAVL